MFLSKLHHLINLAFEGMRGLFIPPPIEVEITQMKIAYGATPNNLVAGIIGVWLVSVGLWNIPSPSANMALLPYIIFWACLLTAFLSRGLYLTKIFQRLKVSDSELINVGRRLATNGAISGLLWGSSSFLIVASNDVHQSTFLVCCIGLVIFAGAGAQAQYTRLVTGFICSATISFVIGILLNPLLSPLMACGFVLYGAVGLIFAHHQQITVTEIIELSLENRHLLESARESMQELDKARNEAESANRAKTRFLAATSHDLRQPLHALSLYVAHLRLCSDRKELLDTLDKADAAMEALKDLLNAVLDLSRISLGVVRPEIDCVHLDDIFERVRMQLQPQADAKGLRLKVDSFRGLAKTDPILLERIFRNIVLNAIRYTRSGQVSMRAKVRQGRISVLIADTGIGIPECEKMHVFEEFYQINNPERDRQKGLGLGLTIVAQLGILLGHPISFRSRVATGTVFRIQLDACEDVRDVVETGAGITDADLVTGCVVLVIDDDPLSLDSMVRSLRDMGCLVTAATDALDALEKVSGEARIPDVIVSDYRLRRGETGVEAIRILRENIHGEENPAVPVPGLIISGETSHEEIDIVHQAGFFMLHKPLTATALRGKMNELLVEYSKALCAPIDRKL
jgi:signal transduction histidine kinase